MEPDGRRIFSDLRLTSGSTGEHGGTESRGRTVVVVKSGEGERRVPSAENEGCNDVITKSS